VNTALAHRLQRLENRYTPAVVVSSWGRVRTGARQLAHWNRPSVRVSPNSRCFDRVTPAKVNSVNREQQVRLGLRDSKQVG
jgi:hypothetical protein